MASEISRGRLSTHGRQFDQRLPHLKRSTITAQMPQKPFTRPVARLGCNRCDTRLKGTSKRAAEPAAARVARSNPYSTVPERPLSWHANINQTNSRPSSDAKKTSKNLFYGFHSPEKDQPAQFDAPGKTVTTRRAQRAQQSTTKNKNQSEIAKIKNRKSGNIKK